MTDMKFTDEEIIKRLEQCVKRGNHNYDTDIVLDLINRQKAEVERYKRYYYRHEYDKWEKEIKTGAYKEFADMVKKNIKEVWNYNNGTCSCVPVLTKDIDNLLKEKVGKK